MIYIIIIYYNNNLLNSIYTSDTNGTSRLVIKYQNYGQMYLSIYHIKIIYSIKISKLYNALPKIFEQ